MSRETFTPAWRDEAIVAWLDGEMTPQEAELFEQALADNPDLNRRLEQFRHSSLDFGQAFAPLLAQAPQARMAERLAAITPPAPARTYSRRALIAASVSFLLVGSGIGLLARPGEKREDESQSIRDLEARYMSLYSAETLADLPDDGVLLQKGLDRTRLDLGLQLHPQQLRLPGAELKMVRILRYERTSIAQIAWLHADYGPMALCISPASHGPEPIARERRHGMELAWWNRDSFQYVLIGRNPAHQLAAIATTLQTALA
ncbi:anti-sigma factor family protein [Pantoea sp. NSTU24]|uniref:anti-sigma factor family protein n=1 Tax=Pantoea sp. NSTU24 TaxID=3391144 RepID=UPI003D001CEA